MKCIYLFFILVTIYGLVKAQEDAQEQTESPKIDQTDDSVEAGKASDPDTFEDDEVELNDLEKRLPSGYETIRTKVIDSNFKCEDRDTGFYADVENDCQIFHRCLEGSERVFSFYCPEETVFSQRDLVCVWNDTKDIDCAESESYYDESNRAFFGNLTAMENIRENVKNSAEVPKLEVEILTTSNSEEPKNDIKIVEMSENHDLETSNEASEMIEKNSIEEDESKKSETEELLSVADSGDYHSDAEIIPHIISGPDASIASSSSSSSSSTDDDVESLEKPQKIQISVMDPIIEMPTIFDADAEMRNHQKRSQTHRRRFLFKSDA